MSVARRRGRSRLVFTYAISAAIFTPSTARAEEAHERAVSLEELWTYARAHAPALALAAQRARAAEAERARAAQIFADNPVLELGVGPRWSGATGVAVEVSAAIAQPVELFGQRGLRREAAARLGERVDAEAEASRWALRCEIAESYRAAAARRQGARLAERAAAFAAELLRLAERRVATGDAAIIEAHVARAELAAARQAELLERGELRGARVRLAAQIGWPVETPPEIAGELAAPAPLPALSRALDAARQQHPGLRARSAAAAEAEARVALADREAWPTPALGVSLAREGDEATALIARVALPLPLWHQGDAARAERRLDEAIARAEVAVAEAALDAQIAAAHATAAAAAERLSVLTASAAPRLEEGLTLLERGLAAGELPLASVIVARERLLATERDALAARADYARAITELERWIGVELSAIGPGGAR